MMNPQAHFHLSPRCKGLIVCRIPAVVCLNPPQYRSPCVFCLLSLSMQRGVEQRSMQVNALLNSSPE